MFVVKPNMENFIDRKIFLLFIVFAFVKMGLLSGQMQHITATYPLTIPTHYDNTFQDSNGDGDNYDHDPTCNGPATTLSITIPAGPDVSVTNVYVSYTMTAANDGWMDEQYSQIYFQNIDTSELNWSKGEGLMEGTYLYDRNISIANGIYSGGTELIFEMRALRSFPVIPGCHTDVNKVDANSWSIEVTFEEVLDPVVKVGINTTTPSQSLDIGGKIKVGNDTELPTAGTIRWNEETSDFEGFDGLKWISFTSIGVSSGFQGEPINKNAYELDESSLGFGNSFDYFGSSVDIYENNIIIGIPKADFGGVINQGKARVLRKSSSGQWLTSFVGSTLSASDGDNDDEFGTVVVIEDSIAVVSAQKADVNGIPNQGKVYVYTRDGQVWNEDAILIDAQGNSNQGFGCSLAVEGNYIFIGSQQKNINGVIQGAVVVFKKEGGSWVQQPDLIASDGAEFDFFGMNIDVSGSYAVVGAHHHDTNGNDNQGKVYIYRKQGGSWVEDQILTELNGDEEDYFGSDVAIDGDYIVIGVGGYDTDGLTDAGKANVYKRIGANWELQAEIKPSPISSYLEFARFKVDILNDYILVGCSNKNDLHNENKGAVYMFHRQNTEWVQTAILTSPDDGNYQYLGKKASLGTNDVILGAPDYDVNGNLDQGKVYIFEK